MDQTKNTETNQTYAPAPVIAETALRPIEVAPSEPAKPVEVVKPATVVDKRRHFLATFFLSFMFGMFGVDRFYLGKFGTGILKLISIGGFGIWAMIDMSMIVSGAMRDIDGKELIDTDKYRKFARNFLWIFSGVVLLLLALFIGAIVFAIMQFMNNGGLDSLMNLTTGASGGSTPNTSQVLDQLKSLYNGN